MSRPARFLSTLLLLTTLLLLPQMTNAAEVMVYTTFGPDQTYNPSASLSICLVTGFLPCIQSVAAPFTPSQTVFLIQIDLATAGPVLVQLLADAGGVPGAMLESWTLTGGSTPQSVKDTLGRQLVAGTQYWVEMAPIYPGEDSGWNQSLSATGTISILNQNNLSMWVNQVVTGDGSGTVPAFDVLGKTMLLPIPTFVGGGFNQIIREVAGPVLVPPGIPVEINLGFVGPDGNSIGPNSTVTLGPGETAILDLNVNTLLQAIGQRVEVRPVVTLVNVSIPPSSVSLAPPAVALPEVTEVFDRLTGFGTVLVPGKVMFPPTPNFELQGLAWEQTMRLIVSAFPQNPSAATLSFADGNGSPVGSSMQVDVQPGETKLLDLNANALGLTLGKRVEVRPIVTLTSAVSSCQASAEVFDHVSGRTWTHQDAGRALALKTIT